MERLLEDAAETFKLLSDKTRLTILALLKEQELCVCDIVAVLETTQPNVSQHLKKLKNGGLVSETRRSQWIYYSLNVQDKPYVQGILEQLPSMKHRLNRLDPECCN
ncbi:ArsR family transcriptional regulator [Paenibacillus darwinianus]|uniref:ArsR family transcriptional regulator n=1 Tax=Paenibacillus darwinianus TaxID=1380763 RepID=A0A9W5W6N7_9BACL|nr:metalloregulator ArsR/SmtB family transcription factor [Paenibacillus darwinianus]EXX86543.1 ArsR family transcriptional regulator [Paenibacillus darwinianus]EXX87252.1 ArsR family transcriptional regulator [Paenibacillus darwinianus]EXX87355.1 ArsR family transcriptional regulator [Paenibacillus darwinianus]